MKKTFALILGAVLCLMAPTAAGTLIETGVVLI